MKRGIASVEIILMIMSVFALSFIVAQTLPEISAQDSEENLAEKYQEDIYQGEYKREYNEQFADNNGTCCLKMENGATCQNVEPGSDVCAVDEIPTDCSQVAECKTGTCFDPDEGLCTTNSPKQLCEDDEGEWFDDPNANVQQCERGCCVLGEDVDYVTEQRCNYLSSLEGTQRDFRDYDSELECVALAENQETGACVLDNGGCSFGTELECLETGGNFNEGLLCSNPSLNTGCERQESISCVDGKDEIYWHDSCGNRENIYSADRDESWNDGEVLSKSESCNPDSGNINSETCGNCNNLLSSICSTSEDAGGNSVEGGDFVCRDLSCVDEEGNVRENGESWCVYDSHIGEGKDTVGSRHWKRYCEDGEIKVNECSDFRNEVCAEESITNEEGKEVSVASCRTNRWKSCLAINSLGAGELGEMSRQEACSSDSDCKWSSYEFGDSSIDYCSPQYPGGLNFWRSLEEDSQEEQPDPNSARSICGAASNTCEVVYTKGPFDSSWECVANCECEEALHTQEMNDFCTSLGDCGAHINYEGDLSDRGYNIDNAPRLESDYLNYLKTFSDLVQGKRVETGNSETYRFSGAGEGFDAEGGGMTPEFLGGSGDRFIASFAIATILAIPTFGFSYLLVVVQAVLELAGVFEGDKKTVEVQFQCLPWQAPTQDQKCDECNNDPLKPCTEYRCNSLGSACELENKDSKFPVCVEKNPGNKEPPLIENINSENLDVSGDNREFDLDYDSEDNCVPAFEPVMFSLNTDEPAECRYSLYEDLEFEEMNPDFVEGNYFVYNHTFAGALPSLEGLPINQTEGDIIDRIGNLEYYVKCQDRQGNYNGESYKLNMCISQEPDENPPEIVAVNPDKEFFVPKGEESAEASLFLNEPAECRYSSTEEESGNYNDLANPMNCSIGIEEAGRFGWECNENFNLYSNSSEFYVKCIDQPWLPPEEQGERNVNSENFVLEIKKSLTDLKIDSIEPEDGEEIVNGFEPITVDLNVETSGGSHDGISECRYNFVNESLGGEFFETNAREHTQTFNNMEKGEYNMRIRCEDEAGNVAEEETEFNLNLDLSPPKIVRAYNRGGELRLITDEEAKCYSDNFRCNFVMNESENAITTSLTRSHNINWEGGESHYVKCEDIWGNKNNGCGIIVSPGVL